MVAGCYLGFVWGPSCTPCKCCELQRKQISMGILFSLGFEWRALLNLLWPVTGLLQQPSKESERHQHLTTSKADKTNFRIRKPWLAGCRYMVQSRGQHYTSLSSAFSWDFISHFNILIYHYLPFQYIDISLSSLSIHWYIIIKCMYLYVIVITCTFVLDVVYHSVVNWIGLVWNCGLFFFVQSRMEGFSSHLGYI